MKILRTVSDYSDINNISDVPDSFFECKNPLFLAAREGQVHRVDKLILGQKAGAVVGLWQLNTLGYIERSGKLNVSKFKEHDAIFVSDSTRVHSQYRAAYENLISELEAYD